MRSVPEDLPQHPRAQQLQSNRSVSVRAVINRSPAFEADLPRGDVIVHFADVDITDLDQSFDTEVQNGGKKVSVDFVRNGERKSVTVQLLTD